MAVPLLEKLAILALLPLGCLMLSIGFDTSQHPDEVMPSFALKRKFEAAFGPEFVADQSAFRNACRLIGALKIIAVLNVWVLQNKNVMQMLAGLAIPGFALVGYSHVRIGDPLEPTVVACLFATIIARAAYSMGAVDSAAPAAEGDAPVEAESPVETKKPRRKTPKAD